MALPTLFSLSKNTVGSFGRCQQLYLLSRNIDQCLCPAVVVTKRYRAKLNSKFPKEDGVTRMEKLAQKMNTPTEKDRDRPLPSDMGVKIDSTNQIFSSYVPVEKKNFILTGQGLKERWEAFKSILISTYAIAMIKRKVKPFHATDFAKVAQQKFIDVNNALQQDNNKSVQALLKDNATLMVIKGLQVQFMNPAKKVHWRFMKEIDRPRVVHARVASVFDKDNLFAQLTVRIYTEQILAIRDRHNRIVMGDVKKPKDVIDYVVLERHLTDPYGKWRICGKLFQPGIGTQK